MISFVLYYDRILQVTNIGLHQRLRYHPIIIIFFKPFYLNILNSGRTGWSPRVFPNIGTEPTPSNFLYILDRMSPTPTEVVPKPSHLRCFLFCCFRLFSSSSRLISSRSSIFPIRADLHSSFMTSENRLVSIDRSSRSS